MEQLGSCGTDFHEIRYLGFFPGIMARKLNVSLESDKNNGTLREDIQYICDHLIQINHQPDAIFQFVILTFIYSSTCFGRCRAHHQELNDCSGSLWFYLRIVVTVMLCSWSNTARLPPRYEGKTRGCHCSHWAPDDGRYNARNMLSCK